ncbi:MAG: mechanosensitive ion channel family protein [Clostridia bacterium]
MERIIHIIAAGLDKWLDRFRELDYGVYIGKFINIVLILIVVAIVIRLGRSGINRFFKKQKEKRLSLDERRVDTLSTIAQSVLRYGVYFFAAASILYVLGLGGTAGSLLATAGIGGIAVGFGAQHLVRDIFTGLFILFEDQYAVGDNVSIGEIRGTVEEIGLRVTRIRGFQGDLTVIPNGEISKVTNYSRGNSLAIVDIGIAYKEDINKAIEVMERVGDRLRQEYDQIVEPPVVLGVVGLEETKVTLRMIARTLPLQHWNVERQLRKRLKEAFDRENIEIPYQRRVIVTQADHASEKTDDYREV